ncbi:MAG TPA: hypothetical protein DCX03_05345 [Bacteroidales bacterium]|jgi:hypothetical protein|nr:hypothetical protein [Bacteroidales bacterium]
MLTIFTIPKPFNGLINIIQRNAITSWLKLKPACEIILFGDEYGIEEISQELKVSHVKLVMKNDLGTPILGDVFHTVQRIASYDTIVYANSDIIFTQDLMQAIKKIKIQSFLLCGQRWDLDVQEEIDFDNEPFLNNVIEQAKGSKPLNLAAMDYFIFPRNSIKMPAFTVGRPGWDSWLVYHMRAKKIPVIDATQEITVFHQNHDYSHSKYGEHKRVGGPEWKSNISLAGGFSNMCTLRDADWLLTKDGLKRPKYVRRIYSCISLFYPWRMLLAAKRILMNKLDM